jgi:outer membrane protein assembly factor BamB
MLFIAPISHGINLQLLNSLDSNLKSSYISPLNSSWPMFGQNIYHTGRSSNGKLGTWYKEKWSYDISDSLMYSSPAIDKNGTIYFGTNDWYFYAINPDGSLKWRYKTWGSIASSPAIDEDGIIYVGSYDEKLYAFYPNGTKKWSVTVGDSIVDSSPVIDENGVIYIGSASGKNICAFYPNGTKKWDYITDGKVYSSPVLDNNGTVYCGSNDGYMYALYSNNGTLKWKYGTGDWCGGTGATVGEDGTIYFGDILGYLHAVNPDGTRNWIKDVGRNIVSSPAISKEGNIIIGCYDGYVYSFNPNNGAENWNFFVEEYESIPSSPAIDEYGIIYIGANNGWFYALNPDGTLRWSFKALDDVFPSPAIGEDGTIYFGSHSVTFDAKLYAIEPIEGNSPPEKPSIEGSTNIRYFLQYTYTVETNDPDGDNISYFFDWGDETNSGWTEYVPSGTPISKSHSWKLFDVESYFYIKVKAKDEHDAWSDWERIKITINLARNKTISQILFFYILEKYPILGNLLQNLHI